MKQEVGLWIDNTLSIIVTISGGKEEVRQVKSNIGKHVQFSGVPHTNPIFGTYSISAQDKNDPAFINWLSTYYDEVVSLIHHADSILIFGPGEAKKEIESRLRHDHLNAQVIEIETVGKMTNHQIVTKVRLHYKD